MYLNTEKKNFEFYLITFSPPSPCTVIFQHDLNCFFEHRKELLEPFENYNPVRAEINETRAGVLLMVQPLINSSLHLAITSQGAFDRYGVKRSKLFGY